jgi:hypothetical protein
MESRINSNGNVVCSEFCGGDRYKFDFELCTRAKGWQQYDTKQDASHFGIWVNVSEKRILTFAEGDVSIVKCETNIQLQKELDHMELFYGDAPPAFKVIDTTNATITDYYVERIKKI